jgi:hypothetical protein
MKKLLILLFLVILSIASYSQSKFEGFFKPVDSYQFQKHIKDSKEAATSVWLFRPAVSVSAMKLTYDKTTKVWSSASFTSAGLGVGYQHYIESSGEPYNNFGFNLLLLYTAVPTEQTTAGLSLAGTISALKFIDVGGGYDFDLKKVFGLLGIKYNF